MKDVIRDVVQSARDPGDRAGRADGHVYTPLELVVELAALVVIAAMCALVAMDDWVRGWEGRTTRRTGPWNEEDNEQRSSCVDQGVVR
jgi:hypothetical protein